jgi:hypothetical protein
MPKNRPCLYSRRLPDWSGGEGVGRMAAKLPRESKIDIRNSTIHPERVSLRGTGSWQDTGPGSDAGVHPCSSQNTQAGCLSYSVGVLHFIGKRLAEFIDATNAADGSVSGRSSLERGLERMPAIAPFGSRREIRSTKLDIRNRFECRVSERVVPLSAGEAVSGASSPR